MKIHILVCENCSKTFTNKHIRQRFCSRQCGSAKFKVNKTRICENCGVEFQRSDTNTKQRFCSLKCVGANNGILNSNTSYKPCEYCGELFAVIYTGKRFCSQICHGKSKKILLEIPCTICNNLFIPIESKQHLCSRECFREQQRQARILQGGSVPERLVMEVLEQLGITYIREYAVSIYSIDLYLPDYKIALEIDGTYWHCNTLEYDAIRDEVIKKTNKKVVRITDSDIINSENLTMFIINVLNNNI